MTGYTSELVKKDLDFPTWAEVCSRALGVCVLMRDDPIDTLPPKEFKVEEYHLKALEETKEKLEHLKSLENAVAKRAWVKEKLKKDLDYYTEAYKDELKEDAVNKCKKMLEKVQAWTPPTPEHEGLKKFMIEQLNSSIQWETPLDESHNLKALEDIKAKMKHPLEYFREAVAELEKKIKYHTEQHEKEVKRAEFSNNWFKALRKSF